MHRRRLIALICALVAALFFGGSVVLIATGNLCITSAARPDDAFEGAIPYHAASTDADGDGIDDQTDILEGARAYVETRPRYRSAYYAMGRPDDGCGVCTDVVAQAALAAGYDLQALMARDIARDPQAYGITEPDPAIDFRRVVNQHTFFERHAVSLTCDVEDLSAWQGGDIAVFSDHVGIVSNRRDADGVPYLIHHEGLFQLAYEDDGLAKRANDIVGHYRIDARIAN